MPWNRPVGASASYHDNGRSIVRQQIRGILMS
jgi:hypothetical protein